MSSFIHHTAVVDDGASIGTDCSIWHFCHIRSGASIGNNVSLAKDVYVDANVKIGDFSRIQNGVSIYSGVRISTWCFVGPQVVFTNDQTPRAGNLKWSIVPTVLETGASIGAGAVIRCGINIGAFSMIGAGAIVTKSVPPFHLAIGIPAHISGRICACARTNLPLEAEESELIRECCRTNLKPQMCEVASEIIKAMA